MKLKVKQGSVKYNDTVYTEGQTFDIDDSQAKSLLNVGVVEEVKKEVVKNKPKKVKEVEVVKEEKKPVKKEKEVEVKPSIDWTRSELVDHAKKIGIKATMNVSKKKLLELISSKVDGGDKV